MLKDNFSGRLFFPRVALFNPSDNASSGRPCRKGVLLCGMYISILITTCLHSVLYAGDTVTSKIRVIHATSEAPSDTPRIDPGLADLAAQLQSVFRYTSYHLLDSHDIAIRSNTTVTVSLPGDRTLEIAHGGVAGDRIRFTIRILKNRAHELTTQILLKNGNSVTIGGPDFKNGYLLFNISGISDR